MSDPIQAQPDPIQAQPQIPCDCFYSHHCGDFPCPTPRECGLLPETDQ